MTTIVQALQGETHHLRKNELTKIQHKATRHILLEGVLYKKSYFQPLLKCLASSKVEYVMRETHEGIYRYHLGGRLLAQKVIRQEYYWPPV
ncbi:hypothetical protein E1A91_A03G065400v1, partial [Gossypium mustelinum]